MSEQQLQEQGDYNSNNFFHDEQTPQDDVESQLLLFGQDTYNEYGYNTFTDGKEQDPEDPLAPQQGLASSAFGSFQHQRGASNHSPPSVIEQIILGGHSITQLLHQDPPGLAPENSSSIKHGTLGASANEPSSDESSSDDDSDNGGNDKAVENIPTGCCPWKSGDIALTTCGVTGLLTCVGHEVGSFVHSSDATSTNSLVAAALLPYMLLQANWNNVNRAHDMRDYISKAIAGVKLELGLKMKAQSRRIRQMKKSIQQMKEELKADIQGVEETIADMIDEVAMAMDKMDAKIKDLQGGMTILESKLYDLLDEMKSLQREFSSLKKEMMDEFASLKKELKDEISGIKVELETKFGLLSGRIDLMSGRIDLLHTQAENYFNLLHTQAENYFNHLSAQIQSRSSHEDFQSLKTLVLAIATNLDTKITQHDHRLQQHDDRLQQVEAHIATQQQQQQPEPVVIPNHGQDNNN